MTSCTVSLVCRTVGVVCLCVALALSSGCKKKDVAQAVAQQAAAEAAEALSVSDEVPADEIGIAVFPGAVREGKPIKDTLDGGNSSIAEARYTTSADLDSVVDFYRAELQGGTVNEATSGDGQRSVSVLHDEATDLQISTRCASVSEAGGRTTIALTSVRRQATFAVYLYEVADKDKEAVVTAICEWKGVPETPKEVEVQRQDVGKLMTVLPRPVEPSLSREDAETLAASLKDAGGQVEIR